LNLCKLLLILVLLFTDLVLLVQFANPHIF